MRHWLDRTRGHGRKQHFAKQISQRRSSGGIAGLPAGEIWRTPRSWVEKAYPNVIYFNEVGKGGHFAAWEEPGLFSEEIRAAFRPLR